MSKHKCCPKQSPNYQVKQRYIPTYVHEQIFEQAPLRAYSSRCTPTFHSTVFDTEGYNIKTVHQKNAKQPPQISQTLQVVQPNETRQKTGQNTQANQPKVFHATRDKWFDHTKEEMFGSIKNGQNRGYSRERKWVDLSSDPVFTDFVYENKSSVLTTAGQAPVLIVARQNEQVHNNKNSAADHIVESNLNQKGAQLSSQPQQVETNQSAQQARTLNQVTKTQQASIKPKIKVPQEKKTQKQTSQTLKVKGRNVASRPQTAQKPRPVQPKPTFTVIRKSRVQENGV